MTVMGLFIGSIVFFVMFGPRNPFIGFAFGAGIVLLFAAACFRFPVILSFTVARGLTEGAAVAKHASRLARAAIDYSDDPKGNYLKFARLAGWLWTIIAGGGALLLAVMIVGMLIQGKELAETTGAAIVCGFLSALAALIWKYLARIKPL